MKTLTKHNLTTVLDDIKTALQDVSKKHGLTFSLGTARYGHDNFKVPLSAVVTTTDEDGNELSPEQAVFNKHCSLFNLTPEDFGRSFKHGMRSFKLVGIKPNATKYPFIGEGPKGGRYKFPRSITLN